jgi:imidazolonepropionase-like amidohydrolase
MSILLSLFAPILAACSPPEAASSETSPVGRALHAAKVLTCADTGPAVIDGGVVLVRDGKIEAVGPADEVVVPEGYEIVDLGSHWLMPGMIDLHCHVAGMSLFEVNDLNDGVYLANPGLRASASVVPQKDTLLRGVAGGVTSVLYIPGSATNIGGQGVLLKTALPGYEDMEIRNPGSMKLAQAGNPERWTVRPGRSFMNWNTRNTIRRGMTYAERTVANEEQGPKDPQWDVFHSLLAKDIRISAHTQVFQVVLATITIVKRDLGVGVFIDHGTIGGWKAGGLAEEYDVPAIVGPRAIDTTSFGFQRVTAATDLGIRGVAAGYQRMGHTNVGFNTDSPVIPQEELSVQAALAARYGFRDDALEVVRGLTIVPAKAARIDARVGSLEVGKDADILAITGHPADPRSSIDEVWIEGQHVYSAAQSGRLW